MFSGPSVQVLLSPLPMRYHRRGGLAVTTPNAAPQTSEPSFFSLTPDAVLDAVEAAGLDVEPVCFQLNSYENRVYDIRLASGEHVVAKFYRPGRWTAEQILEEHALLSELERAEVPVAPVMPFPDGTTVRRTSGSGIYYSVYKRIGGRAPEELDYEMVERLGMLCARLHTVGAERPATHRLRLSAETFIRKNLDFLESSTLLPAHVAPHYLAAANTIAEHLDLGLRGVPVHRIHGDFHRGNLVLREGVLHALDFDDLVTGPAVQDVWMLLPGRDAESRRLREAFLEAYETFRPFDRAWLTLIEPLRGLRMVSYSAWIARRWHDPSFPALFPHFGTDAYWEEAAADLEDLVGVIGGAASTRAPEPEPESDDGPTNADYFWDLKD